MNKKVLLIATDFFGYYKLISKELENQGWDVTFINDRPLKNAIFKIVLRKFRFLLNGFLNQFFLSKISYLVKSEGPFQLILIIKGEGLTSNLLTQVKAILPKTPSHRYK